MGRNSRPGELPLEARFARRPQLLLHVFDRVRCRRPAEPRQQRLP